MEKLNSVRDPCPPLLDYIMLLHNINTKMIRSWHKRSHTVANQRRWNSLFWKDHILCILCNPAVSRPDPWDHGNKQQNPCLDVDLGQCFKLTLFLLTCCRGLSTRLISSTPGLAYEYVCMRVWELNRSPAGEAHLNSPSELSPGVKRSDALSELSFLLSSQLTTSFFGTRRRPTCSLRASSSSLTLRTSWTHFCFCFPVNPVTDTYESMQGDFNLRRWWGVLSLVILSPIKLSRQDKK